MANVNLGISTNDVDTLEQVVNFLRENEQYGDDWAEAIELLENIIKSV